MKNENAKSDFVDKRTGEVHKRVQYREHIFLSEPELVILDRFASRHNYDLNLIFDDVDDYIELNWDTDPISYFYIRSWIQRNVTRGNTYYEVLQ